jgi:hypothetical protein
MPPILKGKPVRITPRGVSDSVDGSNVFPGAMASLSNLIPAPHTPGVWAPRPASLQITGFNGFSSPAQVECIKVVGNICYGLIASAHYAGKSEPFAYNLATNTFETISGVTSSLLPATATATGDWEPPTCDVIGTRIVFTHPGFASTSKLIGWLDISGFSSTGITGNTHTNTTLDNLSSNVLQAGWNVGMLVSSSAGDIPAGAYIASIASNGLSVVLSAAATGTHSGATITVQGGAASAPLWGAGTTNGNGLSQRPVAVKQFNGRAWYAVGSGVQFTDALNATQITNASQSLSFSNGVQCTAFGGLPLTQTTGGILQALIAFQGDSAMVQITGDTATSNLAQNSLGIGVGTIAPNSICQTTRGLAFISGDGLRIVDFMGVVSEPLGDDGKGIQMAFLQAINPTRIAAAFNGNIMRISVQNGYAYGEPVQEFWYDFMRSIWSGPHTFPAALIQPWAGSTGNSFIICPYGISASLWQGSVNPGLNDTFVENGAQMTFSYQTVLTPDNEYVSMNSLVQSMISVSLKTGQTITITATDETNTTLSSCTITGPTGPQTIWGSFIWGGASWSSVNTPFVQEPVPWPSTITFKQMQISVTGNSFGGMLIGDLNMVIRKLGYTTQLAG